VKWFLAFDLGAESGRGVLATYADGRLSLSELGRFVTNRGDEDLGADSVRRWDFERIWSEVSGILQAAGPVDGVGVDSWGVDFGLLDSHGRLMEAPVQYRDESHTRAMEDALETVSRESIWEATGIQFLPFNTVYQLLARYWRSPKMLEQAKHLLMIPDLLHNRLTGGHSRCVERTNASTTQLLNPLTHRWNHAILDALGLPSQFLGEIVEAGGRIGETDGGVPVYAPATHDTGSAVVAVPGDAGRSWAFLSSGTWSLLGVERPSPLITPDALRQGFSNEAGVAGTTRLLSNIMGLWLVQECRRSLKKAGHDYTYEELSALAEAAPEGGPVIDASSTDFLAPPDMPEAIRAACVWTGQPAPDGAGPLIRCCLESLALAYRRKLAALEILQGRRFEVLHIVGGGSRNRLLNQWTADACGIPVVAGPAEATAAGNALAQMVAAGVISGWEAARDVSRHSFDVETFEPDPLAASRWEDLATKSQ
jgi:rhamnulokinase